ncbi:1, 4-beta cellobiohydrolase [Triangularia verruculosa]|uniref:1, 4-beta cellobiohydrolase n=1 Tax=Triangularia verruculosa TaxID=2587418 RepID=A0AAN7AV87_9PEZI|nr:1, 4-beta cellobiohydrolase [Triangularia verruculosa]
MSPERVLQVVGHLNCYRAYSPNDRMLVAQDIYYGTKDGRRLPCRKLLLALIAVNGGAVEGIKALIKEGMDDGCLPLFVISQAGWNLTCRKGGHRHPTIDSILTRLSKREIFTQYCRGLTTPYIHWKENGPHYHYVMHGGGPLPAHALSERYAEGSYGRVYKVEVSPRDRNFNPEKPINTFALKMLKREDDNEDSNPAETHANEFDLEVRAHLFAESRARRRPEIADTRTKAHLLQILATFEVYHFGHPRSDPTYYMLFEWADGDLKTFWRTQRHDPRNLSNCGWMIEQFHGLAKANNCVHIERSLILRLQRSPTRSHMCSSLGDIKPSNVLFVPGRGPGARDRLIMSDFGMRMQPDPRERRVATTYEAPELEMRDPAAITLKADIFSLGCVYLEYITWLLMGHAGLSTFEAARTEVDRSGYRMDTFFESGARNGEVPRLKKGVVEWIKKLKQQPHCHQVIDDLLKLVERDMLDPNYRTRIDSERLVIELGTIWTRWKDSDDPQAFSKLQQILTRPIPCDHIVGVGLQGMGLPEQGSYNDWSGYKMPPTPEEHKRNYVDPLASIISAHPTTAFALIIEPFTLSGFIKQSGKNLSMAEAVYHASIPYALKSLGNLPNAILYLDAGHGGLLGWAEILPHAASNISAAYKAAGSPPQFRGLAINIYNYNSWNLSPGEFTTTRETPRNYAQNEQSYLRLLRTRLQQLGMPNNGIMDTSRNGIYGLRAEWDHWCNVNGAGLGRFPGPNPQSGEQLDAYIWAKGPGYSDGSSDSPIEVYRKYCGGPDAHTPSPERGEWFQEYFETLVREANPPIRV